MPLPLSLSLFFFFSSRRRHTRCSRDWSSDVCSSDLRIQLEPLAPPALVQAADWRRPRPLADRAKAREGSPPAGAQHHERKGNRLRRWIRTSLKLHPCLWAPLQAGTPVLPATRRSHEMLTKSRFG